jgi:hypothetical protein
MFSLLERLAHKYKAKITVENDISLLSYLITRCRCLYCVTRELKYYEGLLESLATVHECVLCCVCGHILTRSMFRP